MRKVGMAVALLASAFVVPVAGSQVAQADGPGVGSPWVVSLGDSYISGEGGRWAGNSNNSSASVDAGGAAAYYDNATARRRPSTAATAARRPRSTSAAASTASTSPARARRSNTFTSSDGYFKPGIDFYNSARQQGPGADAAGLRRHAQREDDPAVASAATTSTSPASCRRCVTNFLTSPSWWPNYCNDDSSVTTTSPPPTSPRRPTSSPGRSTTSRPRWPLPATPPASTPSSCRPTRRPCPTAPASATAQSGFTRQSTGGCGFWNNDANWANSTALVKINGSVKNAATAANSAGNVKVMDLAASFNGRRLCENTVNLMENSGKANWTVAGAATHRVDRPDPHAQHRVRPVLRAGEPAPELVGREGHPQLRAPGVQRRRCPRAACATAAPASTPTANRT